MDSIRLVESKVVVWVRIICMHVGDGCVHDILHNMHAHVCLIARAHLSEIVTHYMHACCSGQDACHIPYTLYGMVMPATYP